MNTNLFLQKLEILKGRHAADHQALVAIQRWVLEFQNDWRIHRILPLTIAEYANLPIQRVVPECLSAVPIGLFDLHWEVHCPHCYMITQAYPQLSQASGQSYCKMCEVEFSADFAERVEVSFSLNNEIDDRSFPAVCEPPPGLKLYFNNVHATYLHSGSGEDTLETPGTYRYVCPVTMSKGLLEIVGESTNDLQEIDLKQLAGNQFDPSHLRLRPGRIKINLTNLGYPISGLRVFGGELPPLSAAHLPPRLSGLELIHYPLFRTLFGNQVLSQREQLRVASVTTVFTDITGSTAMYEKLGDAVAYNLVRDHFEILFAQVEKHGGTVLKTIGDAVMASFISNAAALKSIAAALEEFKHYNRGRPLDEHVNIKIGLHRGPAILVNLNDHLDYFGSTINKAARIQALASSGEICFSEQVYQDSAFMQALKELGVTDVSRHTVNLKGIEERQVVYKAVTSVDNVVFL